MNGGIRFDATMRLRGVNPYVLVSGARARAIKAGWRRPLPVRVRVNGHPHAEPWRINAMPTGRGSFYLYLHGDVRRASGTGVGDRVRIELEFDRSYRPGPAPLPAWFRSALRKNSRALATWHGLTASRQKEIVRYLANLKTDAARARSVDRTIGMLASPRRTTNG